MPNVNVSFKPLIYSWHGIIYLCRYGCQKQTRENEGTRGHCTRKFCWIADISDMAHLILLLSAASVNGIMVCLRKIELYIQEFMDIWLQFSDFCGNISCSICGNSKYHKLRLRTEFNLSHVWSKEVWGPQE